MHMGKSGKAKPPELTEAEWTIMKVVWENQPCAAGTVQEALVNDLGWAYSTVKTTMDRMVGKGLLQIKKIRNLQLFSAKVSRKQVAGWEFRRMLSRAFDGALGPMMQYLVENEEYKVLFLDNEAISVDLPASVILEVVHTEPSARGDTVSNVTKPATLNTGLTVKVPPFVKEGDKVKVDTRSGDYLERAN